LIAIWLAAFKPSSCLSRIRVKSIVYAALGNAGFDRFYAKHINSERSVEVSFPTLAPSANNKWDAGLVPEWR
jgi:lipoprotein signal peptidase